MFLPVAERRIFSLYGIFYLDSVYGMVNHNKEKPMNALERVQEIEYRRRIYQLDLIEPVLRRCRLARKERKRRKKLKKLKSRYSGS